MMKSDMSDLHAAFPLNIQYQHSNGIFKEAAPTRTEISV